MRNIIARTVFMSLLFLLTLSLFTAQSQAAVAVQTGVVSGNIIQKYENQAIKLDNGEVYQPSREGLIVNVEVGEPITLRYMVENIDDNVFFEFASGVNSLQKLQPTPVRKDNSLK